MNDDDRPKGMGEVIQIDEVGSVITLVRWFAELLRRL